jgi:hypothetical protein
LPWPSPSWPRQGDFAPRHGRRISARKRKVPIEIIHNVGGKQRTIDKVVKYLAVLDYRRWETGHPSIPSKGWFTDTRQCHYEMTAYFQRKMCSDDPVTGEQCEGDWTTVMYLPESGSGEPFNLLKRVRGQNCGDVGGNFDKIAADTRSRLTSGFGKMRDDDLASVKKELGSRPNVQSVK